MHGCPDVIVFIKRRVRIDTVIEDANENAAGGKKHCYLEIFLQLPNGLTDERMTDAHDAHVTAFQILQLVVQLW